MRRRHFAFTASVMGHAANDVLLAPVFTITHNDAGIPQQSITTLHVTAAHILDEQALLTRSILSDDFDGLYAPAAADYSSARIIRPAPDDASADCRDYERCVIG